MEFIVENEHPEGTGDDSRLFGLVKSFFERYDAGNHSGDSSFILETFAESFFFCGPNGQQFVKREDFIKVVPRMQAFYKSIGQVSNRLISIHAKKIDERYLEAKGTWALQFQKEDSSLVTVDIAATCILFLAEPMRIVVQIDHQDLNELLTEKGLLKA